MLFFTLGGPGACQKLDQKGICVQNTWVCGGVGGVGIGKCEGVWGVLWGIVGAPLYAITQKSRQWYSKTCF